MLLSSPAVHQQPLIGLLAHRSLTAFAGILGILRAGFGYVPLHPEYPAMRNSQILESSETEIFIVGSEGRQALDALLVGTSKSLTIILVEFDEAGQYASRYTEHRFVDFRIGGLGESLTRVKPVGSDDIAYLLFTSGSTGLPKGVPVSHGNVRSYVEYITSRYDFNEQDRFSQMHDITFDISVHDLYVCWEAGACLCVAGATDKLLPVSYIRKKELTIWASVPSVASVIEHYGCLNPGAFPGIRFSFFCGEALSAPLAVQWQKAAENSRVVNLYGPTETTVAIGYYDWDSESSPASCLNGVVPIGWVFPTQSGRVVTERGEVADTNEPGELCLSGSQVTKGYWKNPEMTASSYVRFPDAPDALWYRTGDLVRKDENGCMHYLGRIDHQVKILGNRVELGEIDAVIREAAATEWVATIPWPVEDGHAEGLVSFICKPETPDEVSVVNFCRGKLPKYMIPSRVIFIDRMPQNANGKIDRLQLKKMLEKGDA